MGAAGFLWGMMSDRFGTRFVVVLGSLLLGLGLIAASRATTLIEFQLMFGVLVGVAVGSFYAPMMAVATAWLEDRRNLAAALVSAGMDMGSMTVAPLAGWLLGAFDWRRGGGTSSARSSSRAKPRCSGHCGQARLRHGQAEHAGCANKVSWTN
jgi:MFS family permease